MGLLYALLLSRVVNSKKTIKINKKALRRDFKFTLKAITELVELINMIFTFIFVGIGSIIKKNFCQCKTVENVKNDKIIDFTEYKLNKLKKAK